ncbi:MAG: alpha/beta fold hydrolase, partial [Myxococcota bacterium]
MRTQLLQRMGMVLVWTVVACGDSSEGDGGSEQADTGLPTDTGTQPEPGDDTSAPDDATSDTVVSDTSDPDSAPADTTPPLEDTLPRPNQGPTAQFEMSVTEGTVPLEVVFDGSASRDPDGDPMAFRWDFGDGERSTGKITTHTYTVGGPFTVTLTVDDGRLETAQATQTIAVAWSSDPRTNLPPQTTLAQWTEAIAQAPHRRPGSEEALQVETWLQERMAEEGLTDIRRDPLAITTWSPSTTRLVIDSDDDGQPDVELDAGWMPHSGFTDAQGLTADMVWVDAGNDLALLLSDLEGRIAVARGERDPNEDLGTDYSTLAYAISDPAREMNAGLARYRPLNNLYGDIFEPNPSDDEAQRADFADLYRNTVLERGAAGLIVILEDAPWDTETLGFPLDATTTERRPAPALWVRPGLSAALTPLAEEGRSAQMVLEGERGDGETALVWGVLPGRSMTEAILLVAHHDSLYRDATHSAAPLAALLAQIRAWSRIAQEDRPTLIVLSSGAHTTGQQGLRAWAERHPEWMERVQLIVELEAMGALEYTTDTVGALQPTEAYEPLRITASEGRALAAAWRALDRTQPRAVWLAPGQAPAFTERDRLADGPWNVPHVGLDHEALYRLSGADTLDKVSPTRLAEQARWVTELVLQFDQLGRTPTTAVTVTDHTLMITSSLPGQEGSPAQIALREAEPGDNALGEAVVFVQGDVLPAMPLFDAPPEAGPSWLREAAARGMHAFAFDFSGHGASTRPEAMDDSCNLDGLTRLGLGVFGCEGEPTMPFSATLESDVAELDAVIRWVLERASVERVHLVTHGWGAQRAMRVAVDHPEQVGRLVMVGATNATTAADQQMETGTPVKALTQAALERSWGGFDDADQVEPGLIGTTIWPALLATDPLGAQWGPGAVRSPGLSYTGFTGDMLARVDHPVLLLSGQQDRVSLPLLSWLLYLSLNEAAPNNLRIEADGLSHHIPWE